MTQQRYLEAVERWCEALNARGDDIRPALELAAHPEIEVVRYGFGASAGKCMAHMKGYDQAEEWLKLTPSLVYFEPVEGSITETEHGFEVRYEVSVAEFTNRGTWVVRLDGAGRILSLGHHPDDLDGAVPERESGHHHCDGDHSHAH